MKARVLQIRRPDPPFMAAETGTSRRPYDSTLVPPVKAKVTPGVNWKFFKGIFPWIPQVATLKAEASGKASQPELHAVHQDKNGMLFFYGYIRVPEDGKYTFYMKARTKAFLRIHDAQVIDEDHGYQGGTEKKASVFLQAGLHPFRLYYDNKKNSGPLLDFEWSGPGIARQKIESRYFFSNKKQR